MLPFVTAALILATVKLEQRSIPFWICHEDLARVVGAIHSLTRMTTFMSNEAQKNNGWEYV